MEDKESSAVTSAVPQQHQHQQQMTEQAILSKPISKKLQHSQNSSTSNSPKPSRDSSPVRPVARNTSTTRSRKNSKEISPSRSSSNPPSAAAIQRNLSATNTPQLLPTDVPIRAPIPQKPLLSSEFRETPRWPISPRLKSPPPLSPRKVEYDPASLKLQRSDSRKSEAEEEAGSTSGMRGQARGVSASNSTLETVQETSQPSTPAISNYDGIQMVMEDGRLPKIREPHNPIDSAFNTALKSSQTPSPVVDSGNESGGKSEVKMRSTTVPVTQIARSTIAVATKSYASPAPAGRGKGEGSTRNMTVETETVNSIPQVAIGGGAGVSNGSLRTKPSSETIRPKKEKKKTTRKAPSASGVGESPEKLYRYSHSSLSRGPFHYQHPSRPVSRQSSSTDVSETSKCDSPTKSLASSSLIGLGFTSDFWNRGPNFSSTYFGVSNMLMSSLSPIASSKADVFEAKIASAVDEADSSDSDETFVYESNPPDAADRPRNRFHSRTPSSTSMVSQLNTRDGNRGLHILDGGHSVALKKSMKFANSYSNNNNNSSSGNNEGPVLEEEDGKGTVRSNMGTGRGTVYHHHIGRWGRRDGNGHPSLFDQESPFPNASRPSKLSTTNSRQSSRPTSPRFPHNFRGNGGRRSPMTAVYDPDDTAADDERTPLINTSSIRSARTRGRRVGTGLRHHSRQDSPDRQFFLGRSSAFWIFLIMFFMTGIVTSGFVFVTTEPLGDVYLKGLRHIVVSEQELMLDLVVSARNPNVIGIGVDNLNLDVFAVTKHAKPEEGSYFSQRSSFHNRRENNVIIPRDDSPLDPPDFDDDPSVETILLGSIRVFDSPLQFTGFPWQDEHSVSTGAVTLANPGKMSNRTIEWERLIKYDFDLMVKGVLKYRLPLTSDVKRPSISGRVTVKPQKTGDDRDKDEGNGTDDDDGPDATNPDTPGAVPDAFDNFIPGDEESVDIPYAGKKESQHKTPEPKTWIVDEASRGITWLPRGSSRNHDRSLGDDH